MPQLLTYAPTVYDISLRRRDYAIVEVHNNGLNRSVIEDGFQCEAEAQNRIDELLADEADEAAAAQEAEAEYAVAAYQKQMDALFALVNAQGGHVATDDIAGQAANRAINDVLAFIEAKAA